MTPPNNQNPPVPVGYGLVAQTAVSPDMTAWALSILEDQAAFPMFSTTTKTFGTAEVLARVQWHPADSQNASVHRGVTLFTPVAATPPPVALAAPATVAAGIAGGTTPPEQPPAVLIGQVPAVDQPPAQAPLVGRLKRYHNAFLERSKTWVGFAYLLFMPLVTATLLSLAFWAAAVAAISQNKEIWERIGSIVGGTTAAGIAYWTIQRVPPLIDNPEHEITARRFFVMFTFLIAIVLGVVEFRMLSRGVIDNPIAYPTVMDRLQRVESSLDTEIDQTRALTSTLDLFHQVVAVHEEYRTWQQVKAMPAIAYRIEVASTDVPRGSTFEVLVLDEDGQLILGQRAAGERALQLRTISTESGHAFNIGLMWRRAESDSSSPERGKNADDSSGAMTAHFGLTLVQDDRDRVQARLSPDGGTPLHFEPADPRGLAQIPVVVTTIAASDASSYDSGRCGGGGLPDRRYDLTVPTDGWLNVKVGSLGSALALYLLRGGHSPDDAGAGTNALQEIACEATVVSPPPPEPPPSAAQLSLAVKAGTYSVIIDTRVRESVIARLEATLEPLAGLRRPISVSVEHGSVPVDMMGAPSDRVCDGRLFLVRDVPIHADTDGTYRGIVVGGGDPRTPFLRSDRLQVSWRDLSSNKDGPCGTTATATLTASTDGILRVTAATPDTPPVVQIRLERTLSDTERQDRMTRACGRAITLGEGASVYGDTRNGDKEDNFALSRSKVSSEADYAVSFRDARAPGAGAVDRVYKINLREHGTAHLVLNSTSHATLIAYFLGTCSIESAVQTFDNAYGSNPAEVTAIMDSGTRYVVVDGDGAEEQGSFSLRWDRVGH